MDEIKAAPPKIFFFGCTRAIDEKHKEAGHHMYEPGYRSTYRLTTPWGRSPDGTLCPEGPQHQGIVKLTQKDGWTAIGFWDRSGDARGNSNSNFLIHGTYTFDEMCKLAAEQYPELWKRIGKVTEAK